MESLLLPVNESNQFNNGERKNVLKLHKACGFVIAAIEHGKSKPLYFYLKRSETCCLKQLEVLHGLAKDIHYGKRTHTRFSGDRSPLPPVTDISLDL